MTVLSSHTAVALRRQLSVCTIGRRELNIEAKYASLLDNVFSDDNKCRVQTHLTSLRPISRKKTMSERKSAVLVPMCHINGEPSLLFMRRSLYLNSHAGEISFPGGMQDEEDDDLISTALRETHEEIGLSADNVDVWGTMSALPAKMQGSWATPVLGYCRDLRIDRLCLNHHEVEDVFTCSIASLCDPSSTRQTQFRYPGTSGYTMPIFLVNQTRIWGLTALILHQVLNIIAPGLYQFKIRHRS